MLERLFNFFKIKEIPRKQSEENSHPELYTEVTEVTDSYWKGRVHLADGSVRNVEVGNVEYLLEQCDKLAQQKRQSYQQ